MLLFFSGKKFQCLDYSRETVENIFSLSLKGQHLIEEAKDFLKYENFSFWFYRFGVPINRAQYEINKHENIGVSRIASWFIVFVNRCLVIEKETKISITKTRGSYRIWWFLIHSIRKVDIFIHKSLRIRRRDVLTDKAKIELAKAGH